MKKQLIKYGFKEIENSNLLQNDNLLIYFTKADIQNRTFNIEEFNIKNVFILVEIKKNDKYIMFEKNIKNFNLKRNRKEITTWKYKFDIIPAINEEDNSMAIIRNIFEETDYEVILDKESVFCILTDYLRTSIGG